MKLHVIYAACFLALFTVSDAQPGQPEDKEDIPADGECSPVEDIVDGEPCGQFIPADSQEASCFISETEQCNCAGQGDPNPVWVCRNIDGEDIAPVVDPIGTDSPVALNNETVTASPTTTPSSGGGGCPPVEEIVDGEPCGQFIPADSEEASCFTSGTEQCNCAGQGDPNPVWACRNIGDEVTNAPEPDQKCTGKPCDPSLGDQCTCRASLECRQRQPGVYQCSQVSRTERNRLSSESFGGAAGRDRRNRQGILSF